MAWEIELAERGLVPDWGLRAGIRRLLADRLRTEQSWSPAELQSRQRALVASLRTSPLALNTRDANAQHYEVPAEYFTTVLGPRLKYSSCLWNPETRNLAEAEEAMLALTAHRTVLADGMDVLELGCGWGSLTLWIAEHFPHSRILAVSNSASQRLFIQQRAEERGFTNVEVQTCDINDFATDRKFDRVVSVEMFEHLRNYELLFSKIHGWLQPGGKLFTHVFYHQRCAYAFEVDDGQDWMARHFFTGGMMPSVPLFEEFQRDLRLERVWQENGVHYQRTLEAWLQRHDAARKEILELFRKVYGTDLAARQFQRWRMFYLACAELFGYARGQEWGIAHFLFSRQEDAP